MRADFNLTCYWWKTKVYGHWFHEIAIASFNLEMEANAEVGGGRGKSGGEVYNRSQDVFIDEDFANPRHCVSYSLYVLAHCCHSSMREQAGHYHTVVALVRLIQIVI